MKLITFIQNFDKGMGFIGGSDKFNSLFLIKKQQIGGAVRID